MLLGRVGSYVWRQMTGSPLPRKGRDMLDESESDRIAFEATSWPCGICPEDPVDHVPRFIKGIA